jgi:hypothetical protein
MSRLRQNNLFGSASSPTAPPAANPITLSSPTTNVCSWSTAPNFSAGISPPDVLPITVDPGTSSEEIIWLIGWQLGSTTGLVIRNAEASSLGSGPITHTAVAWEHAATAFDFHISRSAVVLARMAFR